MKTMRYFLSILIGLTATALFAQNSTISINAQATVVDKSQIELITIKNIDIDESAAVNGIIYVSPKYDSKAAVMMVKGKSSAKIRVKFPPTVEIMNTTGSGRLLLHYEIYGYPGDNQSASQPIDAVENTLQMSSDRKYFFWIGGRIDISQATPGSYDGEFTIQIEYI